MGHQVFCCQLRRAIEIDALLFHITALLGNRKAYELKRLRGQGDVYLIEGEYRVGGKSKVLSKNDQTIIFVDIVMVHTLLGLHVGPLSRFRNSENMKI